jgi:hypothetical protein
MKATGSSEMSVHSYMTMMCSIHKDIKTPYNYIFTSCITISIQLVVSFFIQVNDETQSYCFPFYQVPFLEWKSTEGCHNFIERNQNYVHFNMHI